jgi:hypothetical protein
MPNYELGNHYIKDTMNNVDAVAGQLNARQPGGAHCTPAKVRRLSSTYRTISSKVGD